MVERPLRVQVAFALLALPFMFAMMNAQDRGPWVVAFVVYLLTGGMSAVNLWPIAYRTRLINIVGRFVVVAIGACSTALICAMVVTGNLDGLFAARPR